MKKVFLSFVFVVLVSLFNLGYSYDIKPVFKIYNYEYDKLNKKYDITSYGSAVYIGGNKIVTNAHVVSNYYTEDYDGLYEVCETLDFKKKPKCFSIGKLLYYDEEKDLALLELEKSPSNSNKAVFSNKSLELNDTVTTYGYPSNGGSTITFTSGKISGYNDGYYKIDANLDSGSSGGGAFDLDGNLVGITTFVSNGHTTLGYIVSIDDLNDFLNKKGSIKYFNGIKNLKFSSFLKRYNDAIGLDYIKEDYIDVKNISEYSLEIYDILFDDIGHFKTYFLETESGNTKLNISRNIVNSNSISFDKYLKSRENYGISFSTKITNIQIGGKKYMVKYSYDSVSKNIYIFLKNQESISYEIYGNLKYKDELKNTLNLIFNNAVTKKSISTSDFSVNGLRVKDNSSWFLYKYYNNYGGGLNFTGLKYYGDKNSLLLVSDMGKYRNLISDWNKYIKDVENIYKENGTDYRILLTQKGDLLFYTKTLYNKSSLHNFKLIRKDKNYIYTYNFAFYHVGNKPISSDIVEFFNSLEFSEESPFDVKNTKGIKTYYLYDYSVHFNEVSHKDLGDIRLTLENDKKEFISILESVLGYKYGGNFGKTVTDKPVIYKPEDFKYTLYSKKVLIKNKIISRDSLLNINGGGKYITKIDKVIAIVSTKEKLEKLLYRISTLDNQVIGNKVKAILNYIEDSAYLKLYYLKNKTQKTDNSIVDISTNDIKEAENDAHTSSLKYKSCLESLPKSVPAEYCKNKYYFDKNNSFSDKNVLSFPYFYKNNISFHISNYNLGTLNNYEAYLDGRRISSGITDTGNNIYSLGKLNISNLSDGIYKFYLKETNTGKKSYEYSIYKGNPFTITNDYIKCNLTTLDTVISNGDKKIYTRGDSSINVSFSHDNKGEKLDPGEYSIVASCFYLEGNITKIVYIYNGNYNIDSHGKMTIIGVSGYEAILY